MNHMDAQNHPDEPWHQYVLMIILGLCVVGLGVVLTVGGLT